MILGVTIQWVVRLIKDGQLIGEKRGRDWQIDRASVEQYAAAHPAGRRASKGEQ